MNRRSGHLLFSLVMLVSGACPAVQADPLGFSDEAVELQAARYPVLARYVDGVQRGVYANWSPYAREREGSISLILRIEASGRLVPSIAIPECSIEDSFAVMDAALSEAPLKPVPAVPGRDAAGGTTTRIEFYSRTFNGVFGIPDPSDSELLFATKPNLRGKAVVYHALPLTILRRYPAAFKRRELHDIANLRAISVSKLCSSKPYPRQKRYLFPWLIAEQLCKDLRLLSLYKEWQDFFRTHKTASRAQLLAQRARMDQKYAALFRL
ncbi:MAG: hypothetical protein JSS83_11350 [Cyanobacteria bacterium SZAS LIN-3]|nr:hypothetical protein [Cyanobacteria bacterium SZAS LIN-3]